MSPNCRLGVLGFSLYTYKGNQEEWARRREGGPSIYIHNNIMLGTVFRLHLGDWVWGAAVAPMSVQWQLLVQCHYTVSKAYQERAVTKSQGYHMKAAKRP